MSYEPDKIAATARTGNRSRGAGRSREIARRAGRLAGTGCRSPGPARDAGATSRDRPARGLVHRARDAGFLAEEVPEPDLGAPAGEEPGIVDERLRGTGEVEDRGAARVEPGEGQRRGGRSEEHTSELQSLPYS